MLLLLCQTPLMLVCQYLLRPQLVTVNQVLRVICVAGLALALAPAKGAAGMAMAEAGSTLGRKLILKPAQVQAQVFQLAT